MGWKGPRLDFDEAVLKHLNGCVSSLLDVYSDPNQVTTDLQKYARPNLVKARYLGRCG